MLKPFVGPRFNDAWRKAVAAGLTHPEQIKRVVRLRGTWFITCEVPA